VRELFKMALARKRRLVGTAISVVIGIAFLAGTLVFTDTIRRTFDDLFANVYARTDAVVRSSQTIDTGFGSTVRGRVPETLVAQVAAVGGVGEAHGSVQGFARIIDRQGKPLGLDMGSPHLGGSAPSGTDAMSVWKLAEGRLPTTGTEMAMDRKSFRDGGFALGEPVTVVSQGGSRAFTLVGVVRFGSVDSPAGASFALFDLTTAAAFVGQPGQVDEILARGDATVTQSELARRIATVMPAGTETLTGRQIAADSANQVKKGLNFFNVLLLVFAGVALFVGIFIIYNTFSIVVAQRKRETALLRALGASRDQVIGSLLLESVAVGLIASVLGFLGGLAVSSVLKTFLSALGIDIPTGGLVVAPRTAVVSLVVGLTITVVSAVAPAVRASKVPPVAAMREVAVEPQRFSPARLSTGLTVIAAGIVTVVVGLRTTISVLGLGLVVVFVGLFVLGPVLARPLSRFLGSPLPRLEGVTGSLARENAMRNPKRTARTASALMVGVAMVAGISVIAASAKSSIRHIFADQFTGDVVVSVQSAGFGGLPPTATDAVRRLPEVKVAAGVQAGFAKVDGASHVLSVVDPAVAGEVFDLRFLAGSVHDLDDAGILVSRKQADSSRLTMGDGVTVTFLDGVARHLTVKGIYGNDQLAGAFVVSKSLYATGGGDQFDFAIYVRTAPGVSSGRAVTAISAAMAPYPTAKVESKSQYIESQAKQLDTFVNLMYGLLALAVVIAVFGIANTLKLSIYERTHEIGLLRAVGASRSQVRGLIRWEAVITALLGAVQGVVIGVLIGYLVIAGLRGQGFKEFTLPTTALVVVLVIAVVCGVLAALGPARRAARLDVLSAIATE